MSDYWKSTPKYWCKHCSTYVRDTKLERANHEATGKHKGAVERALRDLHRTHEREEREKERAKREIDRLNGVVTKRKDEETVKAKPQEAASATEQQRREQLEQLAGLGVSIPGQLRGDVALAGEWSVVSSRVVEDEATVKGEGESADAKAVGVRKREREDAEEKKEEEAAIKGLFKKPKRWGRDARLGAEQDDELDALLSGGFAKKEEPEPEGVPKVKVEVGDDAENVAPADAEEKQGIKTEGDGEDAPPKTEDAAAAEVPAVMFKKRKAKSTRQKA